MYEVIIMMIDTKNLVAMSEANRNFSKVVRLVDENGMAVILKNNRPKYIVVDYEEYEEIEKLRRSRAEMISAAADQLLEENMEALLELAK